MIQVEHVWHHYGVAPVLRDVSFHVPQGEQICVIGPNGMGKSTLLGVLAGLLCPVEGRVQIDGRTRGASPEDEQAIRRQVYYLPDQPWLPSLRTGRELLVAVGQVYDIPSRRLFDHVDRLLTLFDLQQQADKTTSGYSNGQKHKIGISAALISEAPVLLLDEPFGGGLDPAGILALKEVLKRLAKNQDITVVMTTPVPSLVAEVATRVLVLKEGKVADYATPQALIEQAGAATLEEALQQSVFPETVENIDRYFRPEETP